MLRDDLGVDLMVRTPLGGVPQATLQVHDRSTVLLLGLRDADASRLEPRTDVRREEVDDLPVVLVARRELLPVVRVADLLHAHGDLNRR